MKRIRFLILVVFLVVSGTALSLPYNAQAQEEGPPPVVEIGISEKNRSGANLEDLSIETEYQDIQQLRFKNFEIELEKDRSVCLRVVFVYNGYSQKYAIDAFLIPKCSNWLYVEYMYAPVEVVTLGPEYSESAKYFVEAIEAREKETEKGFRYIDRTEEGFDLLRFGFLSFLSIMFPDNPLYSDQLEKWLPTPTPTATLTSTPTPTATYTTTPTVTSTSTPTPTSSPEPTATPDPTATQTPTQATLLLVTNNFINDLQEGKNTGPLVVIVLILVLLLIGIGVIIYKKVKRNQSSVNP